MNPSFSIPHTWPQTHNSAYNLRQIAEAHHGPQLKKIPVSKAYSLKLYKNPVRYSLRAGHSVFRPEAEDFGSVDEFDSC